MLWFLALGGAVILLLALPALARTFARFDQGRHGRGLFELCRAIVALTAAVVLILMAWGRPA